MATNAPDQPSPEKPQVRQPTRGPQGEPELDVELDPDALAADRATARTSDRTDARDGVDGSDSVGRDPDGVGGKPPQPAKRRNPRRT